MTNIQAKLAIHICQSIKDMAKDTMYGDMFMAKELHTATKKQN